MNIKTIITTKRLIITILVVSLTANAWYFGNAYFQKWLAEQRTNSYNLGVINTNNSIHKTIEEFGEVKVNKFLVNEEGQIDISEFIFLILKPQE